MVNPPSRPPNRGLHGRAATQPPRYGATGIELRWPWWLHPVAALILLSGSTLALAALSSDELYRTAWGTPKYLSPDLALIVTLGLVTLTLVILGYAKISLAPRTSTILVSAQQLRYLRRAYTVLFWLSLFGYAAWAVAGGLGGVGVTNLRAVVDRQIGAISDLKSSARPIAGLTTFTQLAPLCCAIGVILSRLRTKARGMWLLVAMAAIRTFLYAERLAILEVVVPIIVILVVTSSPNAANPLRTHLRRRQAPLIAIPLIWGLFALSEYTRSWVFYQNTSSQSFAEWATYRLLGYYSTAYNNSAIFALNSDGRDIPPYFTADAIWNAPGVSAFIHIPDVPTWWSNLLQQNGNPEFNSVGSFLTSYAELGILGMLMFWTIAGVAIGHSYRSAVDGKLPSLLLYAVLYIGILELPRYIYWSQGRFTPALVAVVVIAVTYPRVEGRDEAMQPERGSKE